eukprot:573004-Prorocentrum_minimum.AAC.2
MDAGAGAGGSERRARGQTLQRAVERDSSPARTSLRVATPVAPDTSGAPRGERAAPFEHRPAHERHVLVLLARARHGHGAVRRRGVRSDMRGVARGGARVAAPREGKPAPGGAEVTEGGRRGEVGGGSHELAGRRRVPWAADGERAAHPRLR